MARRRIVLERSSGDPEASVQRALDGLDAYAIAYAPATPADWVAPAPTNLGDAMDRIAAAGGTTPVP
jgi:hypothetical protein